MKQVEPAQQSSERQLSVEMLLDAVADYAIYMLNTEGYITSWNKGAERVKGYAASEILGRHYSEFFTPEDRATGLPARSLRMAVEHGRQEEEGWRVRKDGSRFWALTVLEPMRTPEGELVGFAKVTRDMSHRHNAELALRESEKRFRLLVDAVSDYAIFMLDSTGAITNWNSGAQRIKGYTADEAVGRHFSLFYTPEDRDAGKPAKALATALHEGAFQEEGLRVRKDGTRFWANVLIRPVRDEDDKIVGFAKVTRDITEQVRNREILEAAREELHQSQKMEALGHLTGGIAHDFNNFLTAIIGNLELVRSSDRLDPQLRQQVESAFQASQNASLVVRQMLVFARKQPLELITVDVNRVVEDIAQLIGRSCSENVEIRLDLGENLPPVRSDPVQLQTSLLNLGVNGCDAMTEGGVLTLATATCKIEQHERLQPGYYVVVTVSDTGCGMTPEVLEHAFDPFFTTKQLGHGTGLGLSMVYSAMQLIGGDVSIKSTPGKGSVVQLTLPMAGANDAAAPPQDDAAGAEEEPVVAGQTVLYVEDELLVRLATIDILESAGMEVVSASEAKEALALLDEHPDVELLLTDIGLPGASGHELVNEARRRRPELRVLFLTGYDRTGPIVGTEADATTQYMDKPYEPARLIGALRALLKAERHR